MCGSGLGYLHHNEATEREPSVRGCNWVKPVPKGYKYGDLTHVRFEVFTAVTIKNVFVWDIKAQFVLHRRHITSPLQSPVS
jgi:hypothetical protein